MCAWRGLSRDRGELPSLTSSFFDFSSILLSWCAPTRPVPRAGQGAHMRRGRRAVPSCSWRVVAARLPRDPGSSRAHLVFVLHEPMRVGSRLIGWSPVRVRVPVQLCRGSSVGRASATAREPRSCTSSVATEPNVICSRFRLGDPRLKSGGSAKRCWLNAEHRDALRGPCPDRTPSFSGSRIHEPNVICSRWFWRSLVRIQAFP